jgi:hypothetical protein
VATRAAAYGVRDTHGARFMIAVARDGVGMPYLAMVAVGSHSVFGVEPL